MLDQIGRRLATIDALRLDPLSAQEAARVVRAVAGGNRVLLLTSSRRTGITYPDRGGAYQCFDQVAVIRPMAKWSESAQSFARIPELLRQALRASFCGRPGVVRTSGE